MSKRKWNSGKPPHVGWYNASINRMEGSWRWWNGLVWSCAAFPDDRPGEVRHAAATKEITREEIEWTMHWPKGARVPRINPNKKG